MTGPTQVEWQPNFHSPVNAVSRRRPEGLSPVLVVCQPAADRSS
eukprot:CAMPEP_0119413894 /NCGR_PEP_ID=MMETSP1335-20130426/6187_1 /TAXON_ID=259385 /ORGANISM="Chrysoculter rhomboideus, Strain RCC1486" /LENGTH=43 /DNA_ID= /DNA_START= /DNA_END= /DNA_ORIENTATION=